MGFFAALFPGPINLEVVRRAVGRGPQVGAAFGMGAVLADVVLATAAFHGAAALFSSLPNWGKGVLGIGSSAIIMMIGISALQAKIKPPPPVAADPDAAPQDPSMVRRLTRNFFLGLAITLTSPSTITFWIFGSVYTAKFLEDEANFNVALFAGAGVAASCSAWVLGAVTVAGRYHKRLEPKTYLALERVVGVALLAIAALSLIKAIQVLVR